MCSCASHSTALKCKMLCVHLGERFVQYALQFHSLYAHQHERLYSCCFLGVFFRAPSTAGMSPVVQVTGKVKFQSSPSKKQHLHLQMSLLFWYFLHFTYSLPYPLDAVYLLTLLEILEVVLIKKLHKCNKQETGL